MKSKKDEKIEPVVPIIRSTDQPEGKPSLPEMPPPRHQYPRLPKQFSRVERRITNQLLRERKVFRMLEGKERERLEEGEWSDTRGSMLGRYANFAWRSPRRNKSGIKSATQIGKERRNGISSTIIDSKDKADSDRVFNLEMAELVFCAWFSEIKTLIILLDLWALWEKDKRKRLEKVPW